MKRLVLVVLTVVLLCPCVSAAPITVFSERYYIDGYLDYYMEPEPIPLPVMDGSTPAYAYLDIGEPTTLWAYATGDITDTAMSFETGVENIFGGIAQVQVAFQAHQDMVVDFYYHGRDTGADADWKLSLLDLSDGEYLLEHKSYWYPDEYLTATLHLELFESHVYFLDLASLGQAYDWANIEVSLDFESVPEPATFFLLGCGLSVLGLIKRRLRSSPKN